MGRMKEYYLNMQEGTFEDPLTEDHFIKHFDSIFEPLIIDEPMIVWSGGRLQEIEAMSIYDILEDIYKADTLNNAWANPENLSEKLILFLKLKGVV